MCAPQSGGPFLSVLPGTPPDDVAIAHVSCHMLLSAFGVNSKVTAHPQLYRHAPLSVQSAIWEKSGICKLAHELACTHTCTHQLICSCDSVQKLDLEQDENADARSWWLEVVLVRTCEHLLDAVHGRSDADAAYASETLAQGPALDALRDALPALLDLASRTWPDHAIYGCVLMIFGLCMW